MEKEEDRTGTVPPSPPLPPSLTLPHSHPIAFLPVYNDGGVVIWIGGGGRRGEGGRTDGQGDGLGSSPAAAFLHPSLILPPRRLGDVSQRL